MRKSVASGQQKHTDQVHHYKDSLVQLLGDVKKNQKKMISEVTDQCERKLANKCKIVMNEFVAWFQPKLIEKCNSASPEEVAAALEENMKKNQVQTHDLTIKNH